MLSGPGVRQAGAQGAADVVDVLPTLLALADAPVPLGLDGVPIAAVLARAPRWERDPLPEAAGAPQPYDEGESREIAARLASLGYLEPVR